MFLYTSNQRITILGQWQYSNCISYIARCPFGQKWQKTPKRRNRSAFWGLFVLLYRKSPINLIFDYETSDAEVCFSEKKISKFSGVWPESTQNGPPWPKKLWKKFFLSKIASASESSTQNLMNSAKIVVVSPSEAEILPFKLCTYPQNFKILNPRKTQNMGRRAKKF